MAIYRSNSFSDYGDIFKITNITDKDGNYSYTTQSPISLKCVFKNDRMIWPSESKYLFWASIDKEMMKRRYDVQTIHVKAGKDNYPKAPGGVQQVKVYVRSCSRMYRTRYPFRAIVQYPSWISIDGYPNQSTVVVNPDPGQGSPELWDATLTINIAPNTTRSERSGYIALYQLTSNSMFPTPDDIIYYIYINQEADKVYGNASFNKGQAEVKFYTDSTFTQQTFSYGSKENKNNASAKQGICNLFFTVIGYAQMWSGAKDEPIYFGENREKVTDSFFSSPYIDYVYDIDYLGEGKWKAKAKLSDNMPLDSDLHPTIKNERITSSSTVDHYANTINVMFELYNEGTSYTRSIPLTFNIPYSDDWDGTAMFKDVIAIWQNGGTISTAIENATPTITKDASATWVISSSNILSDKNTYWKRFNVQAQQSVTKSYIEDVKYYVEENVVDVFPYTASANASMTFKILTNDDAYEERKCTFTIKWNSASASTILTQEGAQEGNWTEATNRTNPELLKGGMTFAVTNDSFITSISNIGYYSKKWKVNLTIKSNDITISSTVIKVTDVPDIVNSSSNSSSDFVEFTIVSGEVDSSERNTYISIIAPSINCEEKVEAIQSGTAYAQNVVYHDNCKGIVTNITDSLSQEFNSTYNKSTHTYKVELKRKTNTETTDDPAYITPTSVVTWSKGILDNYNNCMVYVQVKGNAAKKGKDRTISFVISVTSENVPTYSLNVAQEGQDVVLDTSKEVECSTLTAKDFTISDDSEADYMEGASPIYTDNGWYVIPLHVKDNVDPTTRTRKIIMNGIDLLTEANPLNTLNIENFKTSSTVPLNVLWYQDGLPVNRKATLNLRNLHTFNLTWSNVPYTGNRTYRWEYQKDWNCSILRGSDWLSMSNYGVSITSSPNKNYSTREALLQFNFLDNNNTIFQDNIYVYQKGLNSVSDLDLTMKTTNDTTILLEETNGIVDTKYINIESHDYDFIVYDVEIPSYENLLVTREITEGYGVKIKISGLTKLRNVDPKYWNVTIYQIDPLTSQRTGKQITIHVTQASYTFSALLSGNSTNKSLEYKGSVELQIQSYERISLNEYKKVDYNLSNSLPEWISISDKKIANNTTDTYKCTTFAMNNSPLNKTCIVTATQANTNETKSVTITDISWRDSELDESWIHLYTDNESQERNFWNRISEVPCNLSDITLKWDNDSDSHNWCIVSITKDDVKDAKLVVSTNSFNYGKLPISDVIKLRNNKFALGSLRIIKHATILETTSEKEGSNVYYVSPYKKDLWSLYYVTSTIDGEDANYVVEHTNEITCLQEGNTLTITPNQNNNTHNRITTHAKIIQETTNNAIDITIIQLTTQEYEEVYY